MKNFKELFRNGLLGVLSSALVVSSFGVSNVMANDEDGSKVQLRLMETTDIHVHLANYDYYQDKLTDSFGLIKTAQLIKIARDEADNSMLFDNGDLIQGNPLGDYVATVDPLQEDEIHPVYKIMNAMTYDAGNLGNHEFNYGLDFLNQSIEGADFPYTNANVYHDDGSGNAGENMFDPYVILDKDVVDEDGKTHTIKVGVIGFVPPQIMQWDKNHLEGKVVAKDIVETAEKFIPEMMEKTDVIVAIPHSGFGTVERGHMEANATYDLTNVEGIDAIMFGHDHAVFPSDTYSNIEGVDVEKGTINGVPAVMPGKWGERLGLIDLTLEMIDDEWSITDGIGETRSIVDGQGNPVVDRDEELFKLIEDVHNDTLDYIRGPVGETTAPINSYFSLVMDDPSVQIVADAQKWYVEHYIQGTEYDGIPVLSAAAPFKAGTRGDPNYYTDVPAGTIAIKNVADLYLYDNTLQALLLNGDEVKEWLEMSAVQFNTIDPTSSEEQSLVNMDFRSYNFDIIDGVDYQIDVTQEPRYNTRGSLINPNSNRILNLTYEGESIGEDDYFVVASNNYRATGGGNFPNIVEENVIIESPDENRQVVIDYIRELGTVNPSADMNWTFAPVDEDINVVFETSPNAQHYAEGMDNITYIETLSTGFAKYSYDLADFGTEKPIGFTDIDEDSRGYAEMMDMHAAGIIQGYGDDTFRPDNAINRAEAATMLARALDLDLDGAVTDFKDVAAGKYYYESVGATQSNDIFLGSGPGGYFFPQRALTRGETAAILDRSFELEGGKETPFTDAQDSIFKESIENLYGNGITDGISKTLYGTKLDITRRDFSVLLHRSMNN